MSKPLLDLNNPGDIYDAVCLRAAKILGWRQGVPESSRPQAVREELGRIKSAFERAEAECHAKQT